MHYLPGRRQIESLDSVWVADADLVMGDAHEMAMLLVQPEQCVVLLAADNLGYMPEPGNGGPKGTGYMTDG